jgi:hypothetical protein
LYLAELAEGKIELSILEEVSLQMEEFETIKAGSWIGEKE